MYFTQLYVYIVGVFIGPELFQRGPISKRTLQKLSIEHQQYTLLKLNFSNDKIIGIFLADDGPLRSILTVEHALIVSVFEPSFKKKYPFAYKQTFHLMTS